MIRIGVIVPVFNTAKYLRKCIDSILNQSYENIEIVLVDDGSTDGSELICDEYSEKYDRIRVIHQKNLGKLVARYVGVKSVACDYVTFVDSDDWIDNNTYGKFLSYMQNGVDIISWQIIRFYDFDNNSVSLHNFKYGLYDKKKIADRIIPYMIWNYEKNSFGIDPSLCNKLMKRSLLLPFLRLAQKINVMYGDDVAVTYPMFTKVNTLLLSSESLYYHRQRRQSERAPYFKDEHFYKKLYLLYAYLKEFFISKKDMMAQLDAFYANSVNLYQIGISKKTKVYIFPFDEIPQGKNIILYGASVVGQSYYKQLVSISYAKKILWVDKNYVNYMENGVRSVDEVYRHAYEYDYLAIAIKRWEVANEVKKVMAERLKEHNVKIIWNIREIYM